MKQIDARDICGLLGLGLLSYGAWLIYEPAAFIVAGIILIAVTIISARH